MPTMNPFWERNQSSRSSSRCSTSACLPDSGTTVTVRAKNIPYSFYLRKIPFHCHRSGAYFSITLLVVAHRQFVLAQIVSSEFLACLPGMPRRSPLKRSPPQRVLSSAPCGPCICPPRRRSLYATSRSPHTGNLRGLAVTANPEDERARTTGLHRRSTCFL